jgi:hypothetical protein
MVLAIAVPVAVDAKPTKRPLSDFLDTQGTTSFFFPPVPDYNGWTDAAFETFCLIDYAGLANDYIKDNSDQNLRTRINGSILEKGLSKGGAGIRIELHTNHAMGFAQNIADILQLGFSGAPTIFGNKTLDIIAGKPAAIGSASLRVELRLPSAGDPLPNLIDLLDSPAAYEPVYVMFRSTTTDGANGVLKVVEEAHSGPDSNNSGEVTMLYTQEICKVSGGRSRK